MPKQHAMFLSRLSTPPAPPFLAVVILTGVAKPCVSSCLNGLGWVVFCTRRCHGRYTTFSDSNGGGCWARALNWGYIYGNVTAHIAWNLIQAYPSVGSGMNYDGHGLMWAEVKQACVSWLGCVCACPRSQRQPLPLTSCMLAGPCTCL